MKKIFAVVFFALIFFASTVCIVNASDASIEASIENLVKNPEVFDGARATLQGFLVVQQIFAKPTAYYLRDEMNNMIPLKFSKKIDLSGYSKIKATGVFKAYNNGIQMAVDEVTPLEASPESQPVTGAQNTLVLMGYFTNRNNTKSTGDVYRMIFNDVNGYYMEASYDFMYITGGWYGWVKLGHTVGYYGADTATDVDPNGWWFFRDLVALVDPYVNFQGYTKFVFVNAGPNQETSGVTTDLWSSRWYGMSISTGDGVTITHACYVPDIESGGRGVLGVQAHEYAHELGMPDLYTYPSNVLQWDLMDSGCWNNYGNTPSTFISWNRIQQGWLTSQKIRTIPYLSAEVLMLDPLEDPTGTIQAIQMVEIEQSYWLIEARRRVGFDAYVPGDKVLVLYRDTAGKVYLKATLSVGQSYRYGSVEIMALGTDIENWAFKVYVSYKGWSADKRLTNNGGTSDTSWRGGAIASAGSYVYAVWDETRDGNWEIYFKRSTNNGLTWEADRRMTTQVNQSWYPTVAAYGSYVYIAWQDFRDGNWEIYLLRSENYGATWPYATIRLTSNSAASNFPCVAAYYRNVHVVWHDYRNANWEIYYKRSLDNGLSWGADTRLTYNGNASLQARVAVHMTNVYVVWEDNRFGNATNYDIFFKRSTNNGGTWSADTQLTTSKANQVMASVAAYGSDVHVAWTDYRNTGNSEIYYRRSLNYGATFGSEVRLTSATGTSEQASVAVKGRTVYVVWADTRLGRWEIYFKDSPDRGLHWTADRLLSGGTAGASTWPSISIAGDNVYVAWTDTRDGNDEVYFKYRW